MCYLCWGDFRIDRSGWSDKSKAASRREDEAKSLLDNWIASCSTKTQFPIKEAALVPARVHLTGPCWSSFRKYALTKGVRVGRREATEEERVAARDYRQRKLYVIWARLDVHPNQALKHLQQKQAKAKEAGEKRKRKQQEEQERKEQERLKKRIRLVPEEAAANLTESAFDIAIAHRLQDDLGCDPFSLYCMKQTCKVFRKIANQIAANKVGALEVSIRPGRGYKSGTSVYRLSASKPVPLDYKSEGEGKGCFRPCRDNEAEISWDIKDSSRRDQGQSFDVIWQPKGDDVTVFRPSWSSGSWISPVTLNRLFLASDVAKGIFVCKDQGAALKLEVIENAREETIVERKVGEDSVQLDKKNRFYGKAVLKELEIDFSFLVGLHAERVKGQVAAKHAKIQKGRHKRPLNDKEKAYMNLIKFAEEKFKNNNI